MTVQSELKAKIAALSPEKRALLEQRLMKRSPGAGDESIGRRAPGDPFVLSFCQQRLWFLEQLTPGTSTYNVPNAMRIRGALNVPALQKSFVELVRRHEV